ncbi:hypothetical protein INT43_003856 [Umbelopsis isabellina]|uniref:Exocyst complex component Sec6 n=1 Tax=Mortierella isabellina TaxID=91625 RepID=A0A8H7UI95_MORIS|nr:hypothetical protein INT43_003856 [Umbelopsis isabellina]
MEDAREFAVARLTELLKHPDDLNGKVTALRRKFAKEKASIDAQLNSGAQTQLDNVQEGLETLLTSQKQCEMINDNMKKIDKLCYGAREMIHDFPRINKISVVHQNFVATYEKVVALQELHQKLEDAQSMFDLLREDIFAPQDTLLHVHYQLFKLEEFRDLTMHQARDSPQDVIITLKKYFRNVDALSADFTQHLWNLARNLLELAQNNCGTTIVKLVKIIEVEEHADEKALAARHAQTSHQDMTTAEGTKWRLAEGSPRTIKSYRVEFHERLRESLQERFEEHYAEFKENGDWVGAFDSSDFIFNELDIVFDEIVPLFPKKYKIFPWFVLEYHRHLYELLNHTVNEDMDAKTILRLMRFVRDYYTTMSTQLGVTEELLEPRLLDGQEQALVDEYLKLVRSTLVEWTSNLMQSETRDFCQRSDRPEIHADGQYGMAGAVDMYQIINQQIDVAAEANQGKLLYHVVSECQKVMKDSQVMWKKLLNSEFRKQLEQPEEVPEGFVEYVMALANDMIKYADFAETITSRIMPLVDAHYKTQVEEKLTTAVDGFLQTAAQSREILLKLMFNDVNSIFDDIFTSRWYDVPMIATVVATLKDYCDDFQEHLNDYLFSKLVDDVLDRYLILYIEAMRRKHAKFKMPACLEKMKKDVQLSFNFFAKYKPIEELESSFSAVEMIHHLLESNRRMVYVDYYALRQSFPDVPLAFVEDLLNKRDDLDKPALKEIMEGIKAKGREYEADTNAPPTIFSRVKWQ